MNPNQNDPNQIGRTSNTFKVTDENSYSGRARITNAFDAINGLNGGQLSEKQVREIVKDEMIKNANSGTPITPRHHHDNNGSPKINQFNILPNPVYNGTIDMTQGTVSGTIANPVTNFANYYIPITPSATSVRFYGQAINTSASPAIHASINGESTLIISYQFQPGTAATGGVDNSVSAGTVPVPFVQGCASFVMTNGAGGTGAGAFAIALNSQGYIAYVANGVSSSSNILALAKVFARDNNILTIQTALASGWSLHGLWVVS